MDWATATGIHYSTTVGIYWLQVSVRRKEERWVCDMNRLTNTCIFHCLRPRRSDKIWGLRHSWSEPQKGFPPHHRHRLPDLPLRSERTEAVEMQWGILGNGRMVGNAVGVSLTLEPRSPQTSSNKSRRNISASGHVCAEWNTQTKQRKCWQKIRSWLKILHKSRWLVYGITTALNPSSTLSLFHVLSPISRWFFST